MAKPPVQIDTSFTDEFYRELERIQALPPAERERAREARREQTRQMEETATRNGEEAKYRAAVRICANVWQRTHETPVSKLTIPETEAIASCQLLGMYPPR